MGRGAALPWRAKGLGAGLRPSQGLWACPENVVAQTASHPLQGLRDMALDRAAPSAPHPLEGDHCLAIPCREQTGGWGEEAASDRGKRPSSALACPSERGSKDQRDVGLRTDTTRSFSEEAQLSSAQESICAVL